MLTADSDQIKDKIDCKEDTVILSGPPGSLSGEITFQNQAEEPVWVREVPFHLQTAQTGKKARSAAAAVPMPINTVLTAGETRAFPLDLELPLHTAPGEYEASLFLGSKEVKVRMVVEPILEIELEPDTLRFMGLEPGMIFKAEVLLTNVGNLPFTIPEARIEESLDIDIVSKTLAAAVREKGEEGTMPVLDAFVENLRRELSGGLTVKWKEAGKEVAAGESVTLHLDITLPKLLPDTNRIETDIALLDELLSIEILPVPEMKKKAVKKSSSTKKQK